MTDHIQDTTTPTPILIRFGGGLAQTDRALVDQITGRLVERFVRQEPGSVDAELSVKGRDGRDMRTTLEVWITGLPRMVATSDQGDLAAALSEVTDKTLAQLNETKTRREPRNNRARRESIRDGAETRPES